MHEWRTLQRTAAVTIQALVRGGLAQRRCQSPPPLPLIDPIERIIFIHLVNPPRLCTSFFQVLEDGGGEAAAGALSARHRRHPTHLPRTQRQGDGS